VRGISGPKGSAFPLYLHSDPFITDARVKSLGWDEARAHPQEAYCRLGAVVPDGELPFSSLSYS
jgi:hypothetical protein